MKKVFFALPFMVFLMGVSTQAHAFQTRPLTCWYNDAGAFTGADTGNPAGVPEDGRIQPYQTGEYAFALRLDSWTNGNDCPRTIEFSPDVEPPAGTVDWTLPPTFGSIKLIGGFEETVPRPDPQRIVLTAGGSLQASSSVREDCIGMIAQAPDFDLFYESTQSRSRLPLIISTVSDGDTTLVISGPDGRWFCNDDAGDSLNASLRFSNPQPGLYNIWVGTFGEATVPAQLVISEHVAF